jgi:multiple sugar transport system permease protein
MPIQVVVGLVLAAYVSRNTWWRKLLRSVFFVPAVCSMTALAIVWSLLLDPVIGIIPYLLSILGIYGVEFLKDPALAMPSIILMTVWKNFGFTMVILVAGVQAIPGVYYEAAEIDGAGKIRQFFHVTVPLLLPTLGFCIITNTIGSFQVFDQVFVMTQGGPLYKTETVVQYIYNRGFHIAPYELGYASTVAVALFLVIAVTAFAINSFFLRREAEF